MELGQSVGILISATQRDLDEALRRIYKQNLSLFQDSNISISSSSLLDSHVGVDSDTQVDNTFLFQLSSNNKYNTEQQNAPSKDVSMISSALCNIGTFFCESSKHVNHYKNEFKQIFFSLLEKIIISNIGKHKQKNKRKPNQDLKQRVIYLIYIWFFSGLPHVLENMIPTTTTSTTNTKISTDHLQYYKFETPTTMQNLLLTHMTGILNQRPQSDPNQETQRKKQKLAICRLIVGVFYRYLKVVVKRHRTKHKRSLSTADNQETQSNKTHSVKIEEIGKNQNKEQNVKTLNFLEFEQSKELIKLLWNVVRNDGKSGLPTLLTSTASDAIILIFRLNAEKFEHNENYETEGSWLWNNLDIFLELLSELIKWNNSVRRLFSESLTYVKQSFVRLKDFKEKYDIYPVPSESFKQQQREEAFKAATRILSQQFIIYSYPMLEDDAFLFLSSQTYSREEFFKYIMANAAIPDRTSTESSEEDEDEDKEAVYEADLRQLTCASLMLGKLKTKEYSLFLDRYGKTLLDHVTKQIHGFNDKVKPLCISIMRMILPRSESFEDIAPNLVEMLDTDDVASSAVVSFISEHAVMNPKKILPMVFERLDAPPSGHNVDEADFEDLNESSFDREKLIKGMRCRRKNALLVLEEISKYDPKFLSENKDLSQELGEHLLSRLHDEQLALRTQAARLFCNFDMEWIIPRLVRLHLDRDSRIRSAAHDALRTVVVSHVSDARVLIVLSDSLRNLQSIQSIPQSPGQIGSEVQQQQQQQHQYRQPQTSENTDPDTVPEDIKEATAKRINDVSEHVLSLVSEWCRCVRSETSDTWSSIVSNVVRRVLLMPSDVHILRLFSTLISSIQQIDEYPSDSKHNILRNLIPIIMECIYPELLRTDKPNTEDQQNVVLFERLTPYLILRVLPLSMLQYNAPSDLKDIFLSRMVGNDDFKDIRKLAAELLARLPIEDHLEIGALRLRDSLCDGDINMAKVWMYHMWHTFNVHKSSAIQKFHDIIGLDVLCWPLTWRQDHYESEYLEELTKLQMGTIDCMALLLNLSKVEKNDEDEQEISEVMLTPQRIFSVVINCILDFHYAERQVNILNRQQESQQEESHQQIPISSNWETTESFRVCLCNSITSAVKMAPLDVILNDMAPHVVPSLLRGIGHSVSPAARNSSSIENSTSEVVTAASLQCLFTVIYRLESAVHPYVVDILEACIDAMQHASAEVRLAALKAVAAVMAARDDVFEEHQILLEKLLNGLSSLSNVDTSPQVRQLAEQLVGMFSAKDQ